MTKKQKSLITIISLLSLILLSVFFLNKAFDNKESEVTFFAMDTVMTIKASGAKSESAVEASKEAIINIEKKLSVTDERSIIYSLNERKEASLDDDLEYLFSESEYTKNLTEGAFNICIYPIMKEWGFTTGDYNVPSESTLEKLCNLVSDSKINIDEESKTVSLSKDAMVDFGGIAKGYATEIAVEVLKKNGIKRALINLGGNVYALGKKTDGSSWSIAIQNPDSNKGYLGTLKVTDKAVITSGGYERFFEENGMVYHHIIDPFTGYPASSGASSVTIVSSDPTLADALSTSLFVLGIDKSIDLWQENPDLFEFIFYDEDGNLFITEGLKNDFKSEIEFEIIKK